MQEGTTKHLIFSFVKASIKGATYTDLHALGLCRATLRRWIMELERDGLVERNQEHPRARAVFSMADDSDMTSVT